MPMRLGSDGLLPSYGLIVTLYYSKSDAIKCRGIGVNIKILSQRADMKWEGIIGHLDREVKAARRGSTVSSTGLY